MTMQELVGPHEVSRRLPEVDVRTESSSRSRQRSELRSMILSLAEEIAGERMAAAIRRSMELRFEAGLGDPDSENAAGALRRRNLEDLRSTPRAGED